VRSTRGSSGRIRLVRRIGHHRQCILHRRRSTSFHKLMGISTYRIPAPRLPSSPVIRAKADHRSDAHRLEGGVSLGLRLGARRIPGATRRQREPRQTEERSETRSAPGTIAGALSATGPGGGMGPFPPPAAGRGPHRSRNAAAREASPFRFVFRTLTPSYYNTSARTYIPLTFFVSPCRGSPWSRIDDKIGSWQP